MFLPRLVLSCIVLKCLTTVTYTQDTSDNQPDTNATNSTTPPSGTPSPPGTPPPPGTSPPPGTPPSPVTPPPPGTPLDSSLTSSPPTNSKGIPQSPYRFICDMKKKRSGLDGPPPQCTMIASSNSTEAGIQDICPYRGALPFMRVYNDILYDQWNDVFNCVGNITVQTITADIQSDKACMVAFDYMYKGTQQNETDCKRTQQIIGFLCELKSLNPGTTFGIVLSSKSHKIVNAFDVQSLDQYVDFYIAKAYHYRACALFPEPPPDTRRATEADLEITICTLKEQNYPLCKVVLMIDIVAYSYRAGPSAGSKSHHSGNVTYTKLCTKQFNSDRVFCLDTLAQFFEKAKLAYTNQMMGIYVLYADFDDYGGVCGCKDETQQTTFPILKELARALDGQDTPGCLGTCTSWAQYNGGPGGPGGPGTG